MGCVTTTRMTTTHLLEPDAASTIERPYPFNGITEPASTLPGTLSDPDGSDHAPVINPEIVVCPHCQYGTEFRSHCRTADNLPVLCGWKVCKVCQARIDTRGRWWCKLKTGEVRRSPDPVWVKHSTISVDPVLDAA